MRTSLQVLQRINRLIVDSHFVMEVRAGGSTSRANFPNKFTPLYLLSLGNAELGHVPIMGGKAAAVVDHHQLAVTILPTSEGNSAAGAGDNRVAHVRFNILS